MGFIKFFPSKNFTFKDIKTRTPKLTKMELKKEIKDLKQEADIMASKQFRDKIRKLLYKEGIIKSNTDLPKVDINLKDYFDERISTIEKRINQPDPLDEIFVSKREMKLIKQLKEQKSVNEHIRAIYKRDLKKSFGVRPSGL